MNLLLKRTEHSENGIFGELYDDLARQIAVTLEHAYPEEKTVAREQTTVYRPKIPEGTYTCTRRFSPEFETELFIVNGVPEHDFIEIHWGNWQKDSKGCILLGASRSGDMIMESRATLARLMELQKGCDSFTLRVE